MKSTIRDTLLSLISMILVFFFLLLLGRHLGIGAGTDIYFVSVMVIAYLNNLIQSVWEAMQPYYIKLKVKNQQEASLLYSVLINRIVLFSILIITLYFFTTHYFITLNSEQKDFLDIYIFIILFQNILLFNKKILNLEHHYVSYYIVDIFIYSINIITLLYFFTDEIKVVAYSMLIATALANTWQFYLIVKKASINYHFKFYHPYAKVIFKNSVKIKLSSILYNLKEPLFAIIFLSIGEGIYSLYNYAHKFAAAIFQVTNMPSINRYVTKINYLVANKEYSNIENLIKNVLYVTLPLFLISTISFYLIIPLFIQLTFGDKIDTESIVILQSLFIYMSLFYLIIMIEAPFSNNITIFKLFNYYLSINSLFALFMLVIYLLFKIFNFEYLSCLSILIVAQISNLILFFYKNKIYIRGKL